MEPTTANQGRSAGCGLWIAWMVASAAGTGLGWWAGWWVSFRIAGELASLSLALLTGLSLGAMQWLVLRAYISGAGWWAPASALGWGIGFLAGAALAYRLNLVEYGFGLGVGVSVGLCAGILQWLVLRRHSPFAGWWVLASLFGWASALFFYQAGLSLLGAFYGLLVGIVTGWALVGILGFSKEG